MCPSMSIALATELDRCQFKQDSNGKIEVLKSSVESFYVKLYFDQCIAMSFFVTCMQCYCSKLPFCSIISEIWGITLSSVNCVECNKNQKGENIQRDVHFSINCSNKDVDLYLAGVFFVISREWFFFCFVEIFTEFKFNEIRNNTE